MSRRRSKQNVRDYSQSEVLTRVTGKLLARHHLLAPCPVKPVEIYRHLWTKEERAALRLLKDRMPSILHRDSDITFQWDTREFQIDTVFTPARRPITMFVKFKSELPLPATEVWRANSDKIAMSRLPDSMLDELAEWGQRWVRLDIEREQVGSKVERVFAHCNTMGQIHRLWPNLCSFLPERGQEVLRKMKVRSRLPEAVLHYDEDNDPECERPLLDDDWKPAALAPYDAIITEALLLPDFDGDMDWGVSITHGAP